ncbi:MAG: GGDEF domain-containing protein [Sumerlaeia bacterium]
MQLSRHSLFIYLFLLIETLTIVQARGLSLGLILVIGFIDYITGMDIRVFALYFIPISIMGWRSHERDSWFTSILCTLAWAFSKSVEINSSHDAFVWSWNISVMFLTFHLIGSLISRMRAYVEDLKMAASKDALTNLFNRREFIAKFSQELTLKHSRNKPMVLMFIDLDDFKDINDTLGHDAGDRVLVSLSRVLESSLRSSDVAGRLGGDEFAVLLNETNKASGEIVIRSILKKLETAGPDESPQIKCSIGAISFSEPPSNPLKALRAADQLMYQVKKTGKGHFIIRQK